MSVQVEAQLKLDTQLVDTVSVTLKEKGRVSSDACEVVTLKAVWTVDLCNPPRKPIDLVINSIIIQGQFYKLRKLSTTCNECKQMFSAELIQSLFDNSVAFDLKACRRDAECGWVTEHVDLGVPVAGGLSVDSRELRGDTLAAAYVCLYKLQTDAFEKICEYNGKLLLCRKSDGQVFQIEEIRPSDTCPYLILSKTKADYRGSEDSYETY